jgi:hypothetical protein
MFLIATSARSVPAGVRLARTVDARGQLCLHIISRLVMRSGSEPVWDVGTGEGTPWCLKPKRHSWTPYLQGDIQKRSIIWRSDAHF